MPHPMYVHALETQTPKMLKEEIALPAAVRPDNHRLLTSSPQKSLQDLFFFRLVPEEWLCWSRTAISSPTAVLIAVSKTSSTPRISLLLHSMYLAPILAATAWPCSGVTGVRPCVLKSSMQLRLWRRSDLRPTRMIGVVGQKWRTSGYHCCDILAS